MISLHFTFLLLLAYVSYEGWQEAGVPGLWWSAAVLVAIFICVVLHEFGHSFTAMRFGVHVRSVLVTFLGGIAQFDSIPRRPVQELLITVAGPSVNFLIAAVLWLAVGFPQDLDSLGIPISFADLARFLVLANLFLGVFNLVPAFPMDGGRILRAILATQMSYLRATFWAVTVAKVIMAVGIAVSLYFGSYRRASIFIFIFMAGEAEYRAVKRREVEEAHLKETLRRHLETAQAGQPPVLER
jgi:Zn-dependent protease